MNGDQAATPKVILQTGVHIRGTDTNLSRNVTDETTDSDQKSVIYQKWQPKSRRALNYLIQTLSNPSDLLGALVFIILH